MLEGLKIGILSDHADYEALLQMQLKYLKHESFVPKSWTKIEIEKFLDEKVCDLDVVMIFTHPRAKTTSEELGFEVRKRNLSTKTMYLTNCMQRNETGELKFSEKLRKCSSMILLMPTSHNEIQIALEALFPERIIRGSVTIH